MRKIDRLLQQVKDNLPGGNLSFMGGVCIPYEEERIYKASANLWNYKEGPAREFKSFNKEFSSEEEVKQWYKDLEEQYPPRKGKEPANIFIYYDDVKE